MRGKKESSEGGSRAGEAQYQFLQCLKVDGKRFEKKGAGEERKNKQQKEKRRTGADFPCRTPELKLCVERKAVSTFGWTTMVKKTGTRRPKENKRKRGRCKSTKNVIDRLISQKFKGLVACSLKGGGKAKRSTESGGKR